MSLDADWRADIDAVDAALIDEYQSGFPVESRPFERVARDITAETGVDIDADAVLDRVRDLRERGVFRRFGAVLNPPVIGSSRRSRRCARRRIDLTRSPRSSTATSR